MQCPNCGTPNAENAVFCGACGHPLSEEPTQQLIGPAEQPLPQTPTQPFPTAPPPPFPGSPPPLLPSAPPPPLLGTQAQPAGSKKAVVALIVAVVVVVVAMFVGGGIFAYRQWTKPPTPKPAPAASTNSAVPTAPSPAPSQTPTPTVQSGFPTPEAAVTAQLQKGWQYKLAANEPTKKEYWVGAPASEWTASYTVEQASDGGWSVTSTKALTNTTPSTPAPPPAPVFDKNDAIAVVRTMLKGLDGSGSLSAARAAATSRFKNANPGWIQRDSDFFFHITGATKQGSKWIVTTSEQWVSGDETGRYTVIVKSGKGYVDRCEGLE